MKRIIIGLLTLMAMALLSGALVAMEPQLDLKKATFAVD